MNQTTDVVICGAGIAGVAAAHFLSKTGAQNILLLDERPPLWKRWLMKAGMSSG
jgi:glycine/D-amino acid oxidase-like deaminating enzyme